MENSPICSIQAADTWSIRQKVMWPNKPLAYVQLEKDEMGTHFGYQINNTLVAVISLFISSEGIQFRKFATLPQYQNQGIGTTLLHHTIHYAKMKHPNQRLWCNARTEKTSFYIKFGLLKTNTTFYRGVIAYTIMEMKLI